MNRMIVPDGKFNSVLRYGFEWDDSLNEELGLTLGLIISEAVDSISDPIICDIEKKIGIANESKLTLADLGCLVYAKVSKEHGTQIFLGIPTWASRYYESTTQLLTIMIAASYHNFIKKFDANANWIFPINFYTSEELDTNIKFSPSWISSTGIEKLSFLKMEIDSNPQIDIKAASKEALVKLLNKAHLSRQNEIHDESNFSLN